MAWRSILPTLSGPRPRANTETGEIWRPIRALARYLVPVAFWIVFTFLLGLGIGATATWWVLGGPPLPAPTAAPARPTLEPAEDTPDSMSLTAQRLLTDLERKYEGTVASGDEDAADKPKRPRAKRAPRMPREKPAGPA